MMPRQLILNIRPEAEPRFDNFVPGENWEILARLHDISRGVGHETLLYAWGEPGCGRSHLLRALVAEAVGHGHCASYVGPGGDLPETLDGILAVDDVEDLNPEAQVGLFSLINQAREGAGRVVAAGGAAPARLALRPDLSTRLAWGLVLRVHSLSEADRTAAVRERAQARGLDLPNEVMAYLLTHARRDLPSLLVTVDALDRYSLSLKRPVTVALLRDFLQKPLDL